MAPPGLSRLASLVVAFLPLLSLAAPDPCRKIGGKTFVPPADALACYKSFPFNETLRQNVMSNMARVFDFFTFEDYYLNSPSPFQESTNNIRATVANLSSASFAVSIQSSTRKSRVLIEDPVDGLRFQQSCVRLHDTVE